VRFREDKAWADVTTLAEVTQLSQLSWAVSVLIDD
jgi:hypothetical protein